MQTTLHRAIIVALSTVALTVILRNAPVIRDWVQELKKPWACNVCLPLYLCALCTAGLYFYSPWDWTIVYAYLPGYALSYLILEKLLNRPTSPFIPPVFEEAEGKDNFSAITASHRKPSSKPPPIPKDKT